MPLLLIFGKFSWFCCCDCRCRRFYHRLFLSVHPSIDPSFFSLEKYYFSPHRSQFDRVEWDTNLIEYSKWYFIIEFFEMCTGASFNQRAHLTVLCMYQKMFAVFHHLIHNVNSSIQWWFYSYSNEAYTHAHISWCMLYVRCMCLYWMNISLGVGFCARMCMYSIAMWFKNLFTQHLDYESSTWRLVCQCYYCCINGVRDKVRFDLSHLLYFYLILYFLYFEFNVLR